MGSYYGVTQVEARGRRVSRGWDQKAPKIQEGNALIAIMDNGVWCIAADVTDPNEYQIFDKSYGQGNWLRMRLFEIPKTELQNCPDEGRVYLAPVKRDPDGPVVGNF